MPTDREPKAVDPLSRIERRTQGFAKNPFASGEHVWLGSRGAARGCSEAAKRSIAVDPSVFGAIRRRHGDAVFDYGELVALSGDFYPTPEALYDETPSSVPWLWEANDLAALRATFDVELAWIETARNGGGRAPYPDNTIRQAWNAKWYVELALRNVDHFGWHNLVAYCRHHARALELAVDAGREEGPRFFEALVHNAFADHFLTDGFAAGHVRVPRAEIIAWSSALGWSDKRAGALSKLLHDQDGHVGANHAEGEKRAAKDLGLPVLDARGERFFARCDGQLFLGGQRDDGGSVERAVDAVAASVREVLVAWQTGELPGETYAATMFVPFPDPAAPGLAEKFPAGMSEKRLDALFESLAWYAQIPWIGPGLEKSHVRRLFEDLPAIMASFAESVSASVDHTLERRLPHAYIEAYRSIR